MKLRCLRGLLALIPFIALFASCGEDGGVFDDSASIVPKTTEIDASGGSIFVSVTAAAAWTIELEYPDSGAALWATADPASGTGSRSDVRLRYDPNDSANSRKVVMVLRPANGPASRATVIQLGKTDGGTSGTSISGQDKAAPLWLELPATKSGDGLTFYVHDMVGKEYFDAKRSGTRNWSFYWDSKEHLSLWVAYPLNKKLRGNGSRSNEWGLDPLLPFDQQPNLLGGSYGGGWTRGHQLPSADRLTYKANVSTFYGTNMTPQEYNFNGEIWARLEEKVRGYSFLADTLYVVTGCQYASSDTYTGMSSGFAVKVPTHYFKALLFKGISTYATSGYMAAGFLLPHDPSIAGANCTDYLMSIDELESKTGLDFFPNLVSAIGAASADAIEAQKPANWWK